MESRFVIPNALQVCLDDVGWWCSRDDRAIGGPSRTGFLRDHCATDYKAIHDFGRAIGQKIFCAFVMGEWDLDDRLGKEIPYFSHFGENWNNSAYRVRSEIEKAVEVVNSSDYIDLCIHGLYHGYYKDGNFNKDTSDYYFRPDKHSMYMIGEDEVRLRLDHFMRLCREHGFNKPIKGFVPPSGMYRGFELSRILHGYGVRYVISSFYRLMRYTDVPDPSVLDQVFTENGVITLKEQTKSREVEWYACDEDFSDLEPCFGAMGLHWPNILNPDPEKHAETLKKLVPYFEKCKNTFGIIVSKDIAEAATQELYKKYSQVKDLGKCAVIDVKNVLLTDGCNNTFKISARQHLTFEGAQVESLEHRDGFINYEIRSVSDKITLNFN
jgi:hypothetical protein